jgi:hypothetical protein
MSDVDVDVALGTVYEVAKSAAKLEAPLTHTDLNKRLREIKQFFLAQNDKYFMLLNRETYNFTLFNLGNKDDITIKKIMEGLKECLNNRGNIISIDLTETKDAFEIWISADDEALVYYLFPYDTGVIE